MDANSAWIATWQPINNVSWYVGHCIISTSKRQAWRKLWQTMSMIWPLDENQGLSQDRGHSPWLVCEVALKGLTHTPCGGRRTQEWVEKEKKKEKKKPTSDNPKWIWARWPYPVQESPWCKTGYIAYLELGICHVIYVKVQDLSGWPCGSSKGIKWWCQPNSLHNSTSTTLSIGTQDSRGVTFLIDACLQKNWVVFSLQSCRWHACRIPRWAYIIIISTNSAPPGRLQWY